MFDFPSCVDVVKEESLGKAFAVIADGPDVESWFDTDFRRGQNGPSNLLEAALFESEV